ncbi:MAG: pitrilysin family protein [Isosphaeraceae bacterium]
MSSTPTVPALESSLIRQHTFPNGLVLVGESMPGVQSAAFTLLLPAGTAFEPADRPGASSMLTEWITRGAGELDSRELLSALDNLGVNHAESSHTLHASISAATLGRNLIAALELFADVVLRPLFDDEEVESIRALALQNLRSLDDEPARKAILELRHRHFPDPWGRPSPGTFEGVSAVTPDELRALHGRTFRPNGAILGVAGAIDWPTLRDAVGRLFGDWQPQAEPALQERASGPNRDHVQKETQQTQIALAYPAAPVPHDDYYRALAATSILGGYSSSRLFTEVREKRALCYSVQSSYLSLNDRAAVVCYAGSAPDRAQETLDVTLAEIDRLAREGVTSEELETMRAGLKSSLIMQQESSMGRSSSLASDWFYLRRVRPLAEVSAALDALTPASISGYAAGQDFSAMTILTLGPAALKFPS